MNLTPDMVADILVRQGYITAEQGETVKQEGKALPSRLRSSLAYEQKAVAYDLICQLRQRHRRARHRPGHRRRRQARSRPHRHLEPQRRADGIQDVAPLRAAPPDDP